LITTPGIDIDGVANAQWGRRVIDGKAGGPDHAGASAKCATGHRVTDIQTRKNSESFYVR
jgi:hypothetical protein